MDDATAGSRPGMTRVPGGESIHGSDRFYAEESPRRHGLTDGFWMDTVPVTNDQFAAFVRSTGYITGAEQQPDAALYPGAVPELLVPGALVFEPPDHQPRPEEGLSWWRYVPGACWRHPLGPGSSVDTLGGHPVVQVSYADAAAFASWCGKVLPTEAQWEHAARGPGQSGEYAWGDELAPGGRIMANYWQGRFPWRNTLEDGYLRTSPVGIFPPNDYGLFDMIGNIWEWTVDWYAASPPAGDACCAQPERLRRLASADPGDPAGIPRKVLKGGSHLCAADYCARYRPAARIPEAIDTASCHVGFRCVLQETDDGR
jgi:formylglycine-generating enzyme